jgi:hypothetical protein
VTIAEGSTAQSFPISTTTTATTATITATYSGMSQTATLTITVVTVPTLQNLLLSTNVSSGGLPIQGTITLTAPAPAGGLSVSLASNSTLASVPASVTVPLGNTSLTFDIGTAGSPTPATATITASYSGVIRTATFTIGQLALSIGLGSVPGGLSISGTVTLPGPAPDGGAVIALASSSPDAMVPASVTIPAGATTQTFTIATINAPPTTTAMITATFGDTSQTAPLTIVAYPSVVGVRCSPTSPTGGASMECVGTLASPSPAAGWRLTCATSDPSVIAPAGVTVPPSSLTFQFALATTAVSSVTAVSVQLYDAPSGLPLWGFVVSVMP